MKKLYQEYIGSISTKEMAASYEVLQFISEHCINNDPARILDLGSGISSAVLSSLGISGSITTCDDNRNWLGKTVEFMQEHDLEGHEMVYWDEFKAEPQEGYDFIFYDLGRIPVRLANMEYVFGLVNEGGCIFVDDTHKTPVRELCHSLVEKFGYEIIGESKKETLFPSGRYGILVQRTN